MADYPLAFELLACDKHDPSALICTSHLTDCIDTLDGVRLTARPGARLDRDIVVRVERAASAIAISASDLAAGGKNSQVALAAARLPRQFNEDGAVRKSLSLRIVLDCSGSMAGDSINWATVACQRLITGLQEGDEFSITRFGTQHEHWQPALVAADAATSSAAIDWLYDMDADLGGTEMLEAVNAAAKLPGKARASDLLLITDGEIWAADMLIRDARRAGRRVFVIGVGAAPNSAFLNELADATEGRCTMVTPGEDLPDAVDPIVARMRAPTVDTIEARWPQLPCWTLQWPSRPLPGETVFFFAGFDCACNGEMQIIIENERHSPKICFPVEAVAADADALLSVVAHERILSGHFADPAQAAVDYQLVTEWTSLFALAQRAEEHEAGCSPRLVKVEQMVPAGWG